MSAARLAVDWSPFVGEEPARVVAVTAITGVVTYLMMVVVLRASGKRTLSKLNAFDFVVSVALGSVLATTLVARATSVLQGIVAAAVLVGGQYAIASMSVRLRLVRRLMRASSVMLVADGKIDEQALDRQRVTEGEVSQAIRTAGFGGYDAVGAVVLETDGSLSVIGSDALGDRSALVDDDGRHM